MSSIEHKLPVAIKLLFNNRYLEYMRILCVLFTFKTKKGGLPLDELVYYCTLINSISGENGEYSVDYRFIQNTYLDINNNVKNYLIDLGNEKLLMLTPKKEGDKITLKVECSEDGVKAVDGLSADYYKELFLLCEYIKSNIPYSAKNRIIVWRNSWDVH